MAAIKPNISDVARAAGVSMKTVSRVINREANVREDTKALVHNAIEKLGYTPSISARALAGRKSYCVNLLCRTPRGDYFAEIQLGTLIICQSRGYHLVVSLLEDYESLSPSTLVDRLKGLMSQPRPDAVIAPPPFCDDPTVLEYLSGEGIRCVRISPFRDSSTGPSVFFDEEQAAYDMAKCLIDLGHERIAFIKGNPSHGSANARARGYERALNDAGLELDPAIVLTGDFHFLSGLNAAETLLQLKAPPTAIFASNDEMAAGATVAAHRVGLRIPEDVSIAGFDDSAVAQLTWPALTTVRQPLREMAMKAAEYATQGRAFQAEDFEDDAEPQPYCLKIRQSTAPIGDA